MAARREKLKLTQQRRRDRLSAVHCVTPPPAPRPAPAAGTQSAAAMSTRCIARSRRRRSMRRRRAGRCVALAIVLSRPGVQRAVADLLARARTSRRPTRAGRRTPTARQVLPVRLHEPELGGRDRRAGRPRQQLQHRRRRSGTADALPAAPQPLRVPGAGAAGLHRQGRADLDADDARARPRRRTRRSRLDYQIDDVVQASETGALGAGIEQPGDPREQAAGRSKCRAARRCTAKVGEPVTLTARGHRRRHSEAARRRARRGAAVANAGSRPTSTRDAPTVNRAMQPPARVTVGKNVGLHLSWFVYRGAGQGDVRSRRRSRRGKTRAPAPTRRGRRSGSRPPLPADGKLTVRATFDSPAPTCCAACADDGALMPARTSPSSSSADAAPRPATTVAYQKGPGFDLRKPAVAPPSLRTLRQRLWKWHKIGNHIRATTRRRRAIMRRVVFSALVTGWIALVSTAAGAQNPGGSAEAKKLKNPVASSRRRSRPARRRSRRTAASATAPKRRATVRWRRRHAPAESDRRQMGSRIDRRRDLHGHPGRRRSEVRHEGLQEQDDRVGNVEHRELPPQPAGEVMRWLVR